MKENTDERIDGSIQTLAGVPGAPGATSTNFLIYPNANINTFEGGEEAFFSRPGVSYNEGGAHNIGQYANFTNGETGFLIYTPDNLMDFVVRKSTKYNRWWGERYKLFHSGNLNLSSFATKEDLTTKADLSFAVSKADKYYVDTQIERLEAAVSEKVGKSSLPKIYCAGFINMNGAGQYSGTLLETSHLGSGKYKIQPRTGVFPSRYMVNVTIDSASPFETATVSCLCQNDFIVNITGTDNGFHFLMIEY